MKKLLLICSFFAYVCTPFILLAESNEITLGATLPLTGVTAYWGQSLQRGIELAVKEVNQNGGVRGKTIRVNIESFDFTDLKRAAAAAQKLIAVDKARVILTTWAEDTEIVAPIASKAQVPVVAMAAGSKGLTKSSPFLFRIWPSDEGFVLEEIDYALRNNMKRAAIISTQSAYFSSLRDMTVDLWKAKTGFQPFVQEVTPTEADFSTPITKIRSGRYDVLFLHVSPEQMANIMIQAKRQNLSILVIGPQTSDSQSVLQVAKGAAEGLIFPAYESATEAFRELHFAKFGVDPGPGAEYAYDAVRVLAQAMNQGDESAQILSGLRGIKNFAGASGMITFNAERDREGKPVILKRIKGDRAIKVAM